VIRTNEADLKKIVLNIKTIAVVGMQNEKKSDRPAYLIPEVVMKHGYTVIPINPTIQESLGQKAYPTLAAYGKKVDMINVFRRSEQIAELAQEILALPKEIWPGVVWLQSGIQNDEAAEKLSSAGIDVVQDACLGVYVSRYR